jgi:Rps23 Pro-64 3,4-dihydroxylase Tpa1-like proline 4-hydroxylase
MTQATQQTATPAKIKVNLLLQGGHKYRVYLQPHDPLLKNLLQAILDRSNPQASGSTVFQMPLSEGEAGLIFSSSDLMGLVTEPPLLLNFAEPVTHEQNQLESEVIPANYWHIDNFLSEAEVSELLKYVAKRESDFVSTSTSTNDTDYRRSMVLHSFPKFSELIIERVKQALPDVCQFLKIPEPNISQIESQLTLHNDGNYYKLHNDNGSPETASRVLTYVYYFYEQPKPFEGGELVIYDSKVENNHYVQAESHQVIEPRRNSIVFFPSFQMHEVLPISCPSKAFLDSRLTINGWIRE